ncbi:nicotinamide riboside transporter PnuC [Paraglaciecola aquimarina]|uniref:Nicotinamide riboside transporter PnuC n=1 Tax=Paraglaciecola algarum TaxID=3050085 RepID=A0ABS9D203_9ALTE|nr:nicotinamide riboside transporter PnuC [Paraglaciecola sp. G1-23]MCF2946896.1 nicotinamide riboside transporter PnuC [Paraglaciecola sp. G1-23]
MGQIFDNILEQFISQFQQQSGLEAIAVILALAYVWLAARQSIWCWPCAFIGTSIYTYIFWEVSLPFHMLLNAYYIFMAVYGWWQWNQPKSKHLKVISWTQSRHVIAIVGLTVLSFVLAYSAKSILDAEHLYLDAFITVFSVFTTVLVAHKVRENWVYWAVINASGVYLYIAKDLYLTAVLTTLYLGFSVYGYINWGKEQQAKPLTSE